MNAYEKMRVALRYVKQWSEDCISEEGADNVDDMVAVVDAALAAPLRNCDKYTSLDEAQNAYMAINEMPEGNNDEDMRRWLCNFHNWLFAPYESEVKK